MGSEVHIDGITTSGENLTLSACSQLRLSALLLSTCACSASTDIFFYLYYDVFVHYFLAYLEILPFDQWDSRNIYKVLVHQNCLKDERSTPFIPFPNLPRWWGKRNLAVFQQSCGLPRKTSVYCSCRRKDSRFLLCQTTCLSGFSGECHNEHKCRKAHRR